LRSNEKLLILLVVFALVAVIQEWINCTCRGINALSFESRT